MSQAGLRDRNPALARNIPQRGTMDQQTPAAQFYVDFYAYVVPVGSLASAASSVQNIQVQADSDFEWIETTVSANLNGGTTPWQDSIIIPVTVQIQDGGSGRQLLSNPVPISGLGGTGKQPFILPESRVFKSRTNIQLTFTNFGGATWDNIFFNMIGRKIFQFGAGMRPGS